MSLQNPCYWQVTWARVYTTLLWMPNHLTQAQKSKSPKPAKTPDPRSSCKDKAPRLDGTTISPDHQTPACHIWPSLLISMAFHPALSHWRNPRRKIDFIQGFHAYSHFSRHGFFCVCFSVVCFSLPLDARGKLPTLLTILSLTLQARNIPIGRVYK